MARPPSAQANNIDALRLIFALLVVFSHCFPLTTGSEYDEPISWLTGRQTSGGGVAVDSFFMLSGFLITQSWERSRSVGSFFKKRICRIYPAYLVAVIISVWVIIPLASVAGSRWEVFSWQTLRVNLPKILTLRRFVAPDPFIHNPQPHVNGVLWTIPYEFWCYVGVAVLGLLTLLRWRWLIASLFLVCLISPRFVGNLFAIGETLRLPIRSFGDPTAWTRFSVFYLAGMVVYLFREKFRWDRSMALLALVGLAAGATTTRGIALTMPTLGAYLLFYLAFTTDITWHNAARYGDFSYGIYVYGFPIQQLIIWRFGTMSPYLLFALTLGPVLLAAYLSWHLVERWFLNRAHGGITRLSPGNLPPIPMTAAVT